RTHCWPKSGPANAPSCWPSPRTSSRASQPASGERASRCAAPQRSVRPSVQCWDGATWPSISRSASPMTRSASPKTPSALPLRPRSTASMWSAPACRPHTPMPPPRCAPTRVSAVWSTPSAHLKTVDLELRPVFHWTAPRVRAHVLLCMLAYYLQWHMRQSLAPMLFDEPDPAAREAQRTSPVAKAEPSPAARRKAAGKRTDPAEGEPLPVHSFHTLLGDLATLTRNLVR